jgi:undecaprenyl pyrophosphate phosphatase UppP
VVASTFIVGGFIILWAERRQNRVRIERWTTWRRWTR